MVRLKIQGEKVKFADISESDVPVLLNWYNDYDEGMFATGVDKKLDVKEMNVKYLENAISSYGFFDWILDGNQQKIGIIKGSFRYSEKDSIWINSLLIDKEHRRKGYGRAVVEELIKYAKSQFGFQRVYVSIIEDNKNGIFFWKGIGFSEIKRLEKHVNLGGMQRNVIIMYKDISSN